MTKREMRSFRRAARVAARRGVRRGDITRLEQGKLLLELRSDKKVKEMAAACAARAVKCGVLTEDQVANEDILWVNIGENIDWKKLAEFILTILPMFI